MVFITMKKYLIGMIILMAFTGCKTSQFEPVKPSILPAIVSDEELIEGRKIYEELLRKEVGLILDKSKKIEVGGEATELIQDVEYISQIIGAPAVRVNIDSIGEIEILHEEFNASKKRLKGLEKDYSDLIGQREKKLKKYAKEFGNVCGVLNKLKLKQRELTEENEKLKRHKTIFDKIIFFFKIVLPIAGIIAIIYIRFQYGKVVAGISAIVLVAVTITYFIFRYLEELIVAGAVFTGCLLLAAMIYLIKEKYVNRNIVYSLNKTAEDELRDNENFNLFSGLSKWMSRFTKNEVGKIKKNMGLKDVSNETRSK